MISTDFYVRLQICVLLRCCYVGKRINEIPCSRMISMISERPSAAENKSGVPSDMSVASILAPCSICKYIQHNASCNYD